MLIHFNSDIQILYFADSAASLVDYLREFWSDFVELTVVHRKFNRITIELRVLRKAWIELCHLLKFSTVES